MKARLSAILLFVMLISPACSAAPARSNPETASPTREATKPLFGGVGKSSIPKQYQYIFEIPSDPIRVSPALDETRQNEILIGPEGGSLSAVGADGTVYQLDIPAGALVSETLIRVTPLSSLEGMPFGSDPLAVQLEPEGLQFYKTAILTITPAQEIPLDQQLFFGYSGSGEDLVLAPPVVNSNEIKILVDHFSGYGVTKGLLADIEPVRARIGGAAEQRIQSQAAELLTQARQAALLGSAEPDLSGLEDLFRAYEIEVIQPRVAAAGESCAAGRLALQTVLGYDRQRQLLGVAPDEEANSFVGLIDTVANVCMKEEYEMCRDDHNIHRIIPAWLGLERQAALLGMTENSGTILALEQAKEYVKRCLNFELVFHSEGNFTDGSNGGYNSVVESKVKIQFNPVDFSMKGQAPLVNQSFEFMVEGCSVTSNRGGSTFDAISLVLIPDTHSVEDLLGYTRDLSLVFYPGNTTESYTVTCEDSPPFTSPPSPYWTGIFLPLHAEEMSQSSGGFLAEDWEILGDEYFAKKEWIKEESSVGITEVGTFKLYHKPQ